MNTEIETTSMATTYDKLKSVPESALKTIQAGRLRGKSDINPQWRYEKLTEVFGLCGWGWKYTIDKMWMEPCDITKQVACFVNISLYYRTEIDEWSDPVPANGGSMFVAQEKNGAYLSDEGYKMAITDALGTAAKMIGLAADVYRGFPNGETKYSKPDNNSTTSKSDDKPWLNATDKEGKLTKAGEATANKLASGHTTWSKIDQVCKVSKKDKEAIESRSMMLIEELNNTKQPF